MAGCPQSRSDANGTKNLHFMTFPTEQARYNSVEVTLPEWAIQRNLKMP